MYPFTTEYNALYRQHGMVIRHAAVAGGAQREGQFRDSIRVFCSRRQPTEQHSRARSAHGIPKERQSNSSKLGDDRFDEGHAVLARGHAAGMAGKRRRGNPGGNKSNETGAVETTPSAKGPGENTCGGGLYKSTNLGDGEQKQIRQKWIAASASRQ